MCGFGPLVFGRPQISGPFTEIRKENTKWKNLVLERVESPGSQRTAVVLVSRGVTLLVCGFDQLVLVMPQTFAPSTETRNEKTKWMNLLLEQMESPGSQRTVVILGPHGVTLPNTLLDMYLTTSPYIFWKLQGLEEVVAAVRESLEEVQTQAVSDHDIHVGMCQQLQRSVDDLMQRDSGSDGGGVSRSQRADAKDENAAWRTDAIRRF